MKDRGKCKRLVANAAKATSQMKKLTKLDPTRTLTIRRAFLAKVNLAFAQLKGRIVKEFTSGIFSDNFLDQAVVHPLYTSNELPTSNDFDPEQHPRDESGRFATLAKQENGVPIEGGNGVIRDKHGVEYKVLYEPSRRNYSISVPGKEHLLERGVTAGGAQLRYDGTAISSVGIHGEFQRRGLASALYKHVEEHLGRPLSPNKALTDEGEAFWKSRKKEVVNEFDPEQHPRDEKGRFLGVSGGFSSSHQADRWASKGVKVDGNATKGEKAALARYQSAEGHFARINETLRRNGIHDSKDAQNVKDLDSLIAKSETTEHCVVQRGIKSAEFADSLKKGLEFTDHGYISTTLDADTGWRFMMGGNSNNTVMCHINLPKGTKGAYVDGKGESELVLQRGSRFKVDKVWRNENGIKHVTMSLVDQPKPSDVREEKAKASKGWFSKLLGNKEQGKFIWDEGDIELHEATDNSNPNHDELGRFTSSGIQKALPSTTEWRAELEKVFDKTGMNGKLDESKLRNLCKPVTEHLKKLLEDKGVDVSLIGGTYKTSDTTTEGHYWLEHTDRNLVTTIIDPTVSQFKKDAPVTTIATYGEGSKEAKKYKSQVNLEFLDNSTVNNVELSTFRQLEKHDCGVAAFKSAIDSLDAEVPFLSQRLKVTKEEGTEPEAMVKVAKDLGLSAFISENLSIGDLRRYLDSGSPVICLVTMWGGGHYVTASSVREGRVYFMDPSIGKRSMPVKRFLRVWHDEETTRLGVVLSKASPTDTDPLPSKFSWKEGDVQLHDSTSNSNPNHDERGRFSVFEVSSPSVEQWHKAQKEVIDRMGDHEDAGTDHGKEYAGLYVMALALGSKPSKDDSLVLVHKEGKLGAAGRISYGHDGTKANIEYIGSTVKGGGTEAMRQLLKQAKEKGVKEVTADASPDAIPLNKKFGFVMDGKFGPNGQPMKMVLNLSLFSITHNANPNHDELGRFSGPGSGKVKTAKVSEDALKAYKDLGLKGELKLTGSLSRGESGNDADLIYTPSSKDGGWKNIADKMMFLSFQVSVQGKENATSVDTLHKTDVFWSPTEQMKEDPKLAKAYGMTHKELKKCKYLIESTGGGGFIRGHWNRDIDIGKSIVSNVTIDGLTNNSNPNHDELGRFSSEQATVDKILSTLHPMLQKAARKAIYNPTAGTYAVPGKHISIGKGIGGPEARKHIYEHEAAHNLASDMRDHPDVKNWNFIRSQDPHPEGWTTYTKQGGEDFAESMRYYMSGKAPGGTKYEGKTFKESFPSRSAALERILKDAADHYEKPTNNLTTNEPPNWTPSSSQEKLSGFQEWLKTQVNSLLVGQSQEALWRAYIEQGWRKGVGRTFDDVNRATPQWTPQQQDFYAGSRDQFLRSSFNQPVAKEKVELLAARTFDEMENVTDDMSNKMSRALADGLVEGNSPHEVAKALTEVVDFSRQRAEVVARTECIRAHNEGQLTAMEQLGVEDVGVEVEWLATADEKTCPICAELEGAVFSIKDAHGMLPRHPSCRCTWVPNVEKT